MVVCKRGEGISTPWAYRRLDELYRNFTEEYDGGTAERGLYGELLRGIEEKNAVTLQKGMYNIFESAVLPVHEEARLLRDEMRALGAKASLLSGSGPSVFGVFPSEDLAARAAEALNRAAGKTIAFAVLPIGRADIVKFAEII